MAETPSSLIDIIERIKRIAIEPTREPTNMLEPDQWDAVLSRITGTIYRGTERISSNALLNALEVGPDPIARQKVAKRSRHGAHLFECTIKGVGGWS
jgi:hypothetical protein